ncbi:MAG: tetratricopeptide repeat protein, partial [Candidatus Hydrogenedentes bacterium]|nr:tetratricopeptide repeat protein [Candidatus Hydrogenedentota bacterium]
HTSFTERSLYFGICGLALLLPVIVAKLLWKRPVAIVAGLAVFAVLLMMGAGTFTRNSLWQNEMLLWEDAAAKSPEAPEPFIRLGEIHYENAQTAYTESQAFARQEERAAASSRREDAQREFGFAQSFLQKAVEITPDDARLRNILGVTLAFMNKREEAITMLTEALRLDPSLDECTVQLASLYEYNPDDPANLEEKQRALDYFRRAERLEALEPGARITYALTLARTGNVGGAARALAPLDPANPNSPAAEPMRQLTPLLEQLQTAQQEYREVETASAGSKESILAQIDYLLADGQTLQAFYLLDRFVRYNPDDFTAWLLMGLTRARVGGAEKFIAEHPVAPVAPEGAQPAWLQLARRSAESGRWDAVRTYLEFAATQSDVYASPLVTFSDLAIELKQLAVASATLTELTKSQPENPLPWLRLCDIALQSNNLPQARRYLDEAERLGAEPALVASLRAKAGETPEEEKGRSRTILD